MKIGIYWFLNACPWWIFVVAINFLVIGILFVIRDRREGMPYNISVASQQGDGVGLLGFIFLGVYVLQRIPSLPSWMGIGFQSALFAISGIFAVGYQRVIISARGKKTTAADAFHNVFIAPLLLFCIAALAPIIWLYGDNWEQIAAACLLAVWLFALAFDINDGRLDQPEWLARNGIDLEMRQWRKDDPLSGTMPDIIP